jgi:stage IV sporulation protein FB
MKKHITVKSFRPLGASFEVHWSVIVASVLLLAGGIEAPVISLIALFAYLSIIFVHEIGHGLMAVHCGCQVYSIKLGFIHGSCTVEAPFDEWDQVKIAWGGVLAQLAVAFFVFIPALIISGVNLSYYEVILIFLGYFNLFIALVNLAPSKGLDGYVAWRVIPLYLRQLKAKSVSANALKKARGK